MKKILYILLAVVFVAFSYVNLNDPDPVVWVAAYGAVAVLFAFAAFGAFAAWFFARLAGDIRRLEAHARLIVQGRRGVALDVQRDDELGRLMHAVNRMAADLDEREQRLQIDEQQRSHREKLQAVGALAAGVAHEVNNPLAVIAGVAQDLGSLEGSVPAPRVAQAAQLILSQAQRASQASRNLAELAAPQPTEFDWVDVNAMVRRVLQLMGYDRRYRGIGFHSELDGELPADQRAAFEAHLVGCPRCQAGLHELMQLTIASLPAAEAAAAPPRVVPLLRRRALWVAAPLLAAAAAAVLYLRGPGPGPEDMSHRPDAIATLELGKTRGLAARLSYAPADAHRPYTVLRSAAAPGEAIALTELARLEAAGDLAEAAVARDDDVAVFGRDVVEGPRASLRFAGREGAISSDEQQRGDDHRQRHHDPVEIRADL